ncbi:hypothetical protein [Streptomyces halstedii]|uniref:hypothetical protein n=1 Tax=Streptomyces halstedii TaxID=1944 RepID=UPI00368DF745
MRTTTALPRRVMSSRENFLLSPSGLLHGGSASTDGNPSMWRLSSSATEGQIHRADLLSLRQGEVQPSVNRGHSACAAVGAGALRLRAVAALVAGGPGSAGDAPSRQAGRDASTSSAEGSFQRPYKRTVEQDPEAVTRWHAENAPEIRARARADGREVLFADQVGTRSDHDTGLREDAFKLIKTVISSESMSEVTGQKFAIPENLHPKYR